MSKFPYRPNVCLMILNRENKILVGERYDHSDAWQLPQGGLDLESDLENDNHLVANALREAGEELGTSENKFELVAILQARHAYDWSKPRPYDTHTYRGQQQRFVVLRFLGSEKSLAPEKVIEPEFSQFKWVEFGDVQKIVESQRRKGYEDALHELMQLAF